MINVNNQTVSPSQAPAHVAASIAKNAVPKMRSGEAGASTAAETARSLARQARQSLVQLGQSAEGRTALGTALDGKGLHDRAVEEQVLLDQMFERMAQDPSFRPEVVMAKPGQLPSGVSGAYIKEKGVILVRPDLSETEQLATLREEMGEWLAAAAKKAGITLAAGDAGSRVRSVLRDEEIANGDFIAKASDTAEVTFEGETYEAAARADAMRPWLNFVGQGTDWYNLAQAGRVIPLRGLSPHNTAALIQILLGNQQMTGQNLFSWAQKGALYLENKPGGRIGINLNKVTAGDNGRIVRALFDLTDNKNPVWRLNLSPANAQNGGSQRQRYGNALLNGLGLRDVPEGRAADYNGNRNGKAERWELIQGYQKNKLTFRQGRGSQQTTRQRNAGAGAPKPSAPPKPVNGWQMLNRLKAPGARNWVQMISAGVKMGGHGMNEGVATQILQLMHDGKPLPGWAINYYQNIGMLKPNAQGIYFDLSVLNQPKNKNIRDKLIFNLIRYYRGTGNVMAPGGIGTGVAAQQRKNNAISVYRALNFNTLVGYIGEKGSDWRIAQAFTKNQAEFRSNKTFRKAAAPAPTVNKAVPKPGPVPRSVNSVFKSKGGNVNLTISNPPATSRGFVQQVVSGRRVNILPIYNDVMDAGFSEFRNFAANIRLVTDKMKLLLNDNAGLALLKEVARLNPKGIFIGESGRPTNSPGLSDSARRLVTLYGNDSLGQMLISLISTLDYSGSGYRSQGAEWKKAKDSGNLTNAATRTPARTPNTNSRFFFAEIGSLWFMARTGRMSPQDTANFLKDHKARVAYFDKHFAAKLGIRVPAPVVQRPPQANPEAYKRQIANRAIEEVAKKNPAVGFQLSSISKGNTTPLTQRLHKSVTDLANALNDEITNRTLQHVKRFATPGTPEFKILKDWSDKVIRSALANNGDVKAAINRIGKPYNLRGFPGLKPSAFSHVSLGIVVEPQISERLYLLYKAAKIALYAWQGRPQAEINRIRVARFLPNVSLRAFAKFVDLKKQQTVLDPFNPSWLFVFRGGVNGSGGFAGSGAFAAAGFEIHVEFKGKKVESVSVLLQAEVGVIGDITGGVNALARHLRGQPIPAPTAANTSVRGKAVAKVEAIKLTWLRNEKGWIDRTPDLFSFVGLGAIGGDFKTVFFGSEVDSEIMYVNGGEAVYALTRSGDRELFSGKTRPVAP